MNSSTLPRLFSSSTRASDALVTLRPVKQENKPNESLRADELLKEKIRLETASEGAVMESPKEMLPRKQRENEEKEGEVYEEISKYLIIPEIIHDTGDSGFGTLALDLLSEVTDTEECIITEKHIGRKPSQLFPPTISSFKDQSIESAKDVSMVTYKEETTFNNKILDEPQVSNHEDSFEFIKEERMLKIYDIDTIDSVLPSCCEQQEDKLDSNNLCIKVIVPEFDCTEIVAIDLKTAKFDPRLSCIVEEDDQDKILSTLFDDNCNYCKL